jgi:hypothetical protein
VVPASFSQTARHGTNGPQCEEQAVRLDHGALVHVGDQGLRFRWHNPGSPGPVSALADHPDPAMGCAAASARKAANVFNPDAELEVEQGPAQQGLREENDTQCPSKLQRPAPRQST